MAMNLIILLTFTTAYSTNESSDEFHQIFNVTNNGTSEGTATSWNTTEESFFDEDAFLEATAISEKVENGFWDAWESQNRSFLESYTFLPPVPSQQRSVTEASYLAVVTMSRGEGGDFVMTSPTPVTVEVTTYSQEDQVNKPPGDIWPVKLAAEVPGDLIIGGLMMVHEREDTITCGPIMPQGGIQAVETMLYTLDTVNKGFQHFSIGVHILDDCDKDTYGLEMAVDFIKDDRCAEGRSSSIIICNIRRQSCTLGRC